MIHSHIVMLLHVNTTQVKAAVMQFVNCMIMGSDFDGFTLLRSDLTSQVCKAVVTIFL